MTDKANAPHGERGDFLKVTATLSPEVYKLVSDEMQRRKLAREPNAQLSAILREAVLSHLTERSRNVRYDRVQVVGESAIRMRRHRARRAAGLKCITIDVPLNYNEMAAAR